MPTYIVILRHLATDTHWIEVIEADSKDAAIREACDRRNIPSMWEVAEIELDPDRN